MFLRGASPLSDSHNITMKKQSLNDLDELAEVGCAAATKPFYRAALNEYGLPYPSPALVHGQYLKYLEVLIAALQKEQNRARSLRAAVKQGRGWIG
jgi:hypothetical protein